MVEQRTENAWVPGSSPGLGKTEKAQLKRGLEIIKKSDIIGVVLNGSEHTSRDYYARYVAKAELKPNNGVFPDVV